MDTNKINKNIKSEIEIDYDRIKLCKGQCKELRKILKLAQFILQKHEECLEMAKKVAEGKTTSKEYQVAREAALRAKHEYDLARDSFEGSMQ